MYNLPLCDFVYKVLPRMRIFDLDNAVPTKIFSLSMKHIFNYDWQLFYVKAQMVAFIKNILRTWRTVINCPCAHTSKSKNIFTEGFDRSKLWLLY